MALLFLGSPVIPKCPPQFIVRASPLTSSSIHLVQLGCSRPLLRFTRTVIHCNAENSEGYQQIQVEDLRVPDHWLIPSKAIQESEWLRVTLHKWLDDEYCPEPTNIEISKIASLSYYESLVGQQTDLGEILLKLVRDLQSISYQESFHGAFSSANAAVHLIALRMESDSQS